MSKEAQRRETYEITFIRQWGQDQAVGVADAKILLGGTTSPDPSGARPPVEKAGLGPKPRDPNPPVGEEGLGPKLRDPNPPVGKAVGLGPMLIGPKPPGGIAKAASRANGGSWLDGSLSWSYSKAEKEKLTVIETYHQCQRR